MEFQLGFEQISGQHSGANIAHVLMEVLIRYEIDDGRLLGITTDNASSNYVTSACLQNALEIVGVTWPAANNHMPCIAHVIQLSLGAFMKELKITGRESYYQEEERDQLKKDKKGRSRIERFNDMPRGFKKIVEKVCKDCQALFPFPTTLLRSILQRLDVSPFGRALYVFDDAYTSLTSLIHL